ncbi:hypothetical protein BTO32_14635 [Marinobacter lutaoensis]|uniref:DUF2007 domain-containing protein n=1 Tax=Marinobacter lutaoensis TaxID=135739 RepID=A0A1V2DRE6_9GAMM|nr:DUF2007 domain-containing protein [Marinobacter lutaoensis]ONF42911.1 hypothetical protein BTO32_14635 [Marinobacter lutaoensis]
MQIAYRARDITEAYIVAGLLEANGIDAYVGGHYLQGALGEIGVAGFSNVHVEDGDYARARVLVREYESSHAHDSEPARDDTPDRYARWFLLALVVTVWLLIQFN